MSLNGRGFTQGGIASYCHPGLLLLIKTMNLILYSNDQHRSWQMEQKLNSDLKDERLFSNAAILPNAMLCTVLFSPK
ncbi:MAG: hypothetical protein A2546_06160 [Sphingobacteriia bacterium RIFOXYD2_FULL_35_12]|nr:MAG: hypothetical protein A2472_14065 [Sphingobacteriia bacterium RIFOXYC2_FULL_35_18]OHC88898.1 MAG: hypothetical protein A2546_06160 [Sphingobacteriia bacterium RIFOXYD2_FULL_35_12]